MQVKLDDYIGTKVQTFDFRRAQDEKKKERKTYDGDAKGDEESEDEDGGWDNFQSFPALQLILQLNHMMVQPASLNPSS